MAEALQDDLLYGNIGLVPLAKLKVVLNVLRSIRCGQFAVFVNSLSTQIADITEFIIVK